METLFTIHDVLESKRRFWSPEDVEGGEALLRELESRQELVQAYPHLYWRGIMTRFGMARPPIHLLLSHLIPGGGWGYSGYSGANHLGLSTQIPKYVLVAVPSLLPYDPPYDTQFVHRPDRTKRAVYKLGAYEATFLEVLSDWVEGHDYSEHSRDESLSILRNDVLSRRMMENGIHLESMVAASFGEPDGVRELLNRIIMD